MASGGRRVNAIELNKIGLYVAAVSIPHIVIKLTSMPVAYVNVSPWTTNCGMETAATIASFNETT